MTPNKNILIIIIVIILAASAAFGWYFLLRGPSGGETGAPQGGQGGFQPFNRPSSGGTQGGIGTNTEPGTTGGATSTSTSSGAPVKIPILRLISATPVGGYGASTTGSTTVVRWIDRGRGNVYETNNFTLETSVLSNTVVPRMYESVWNKNLTALIGSILEDSEGNVKTLYAELIPRKIAAAGSASGSASGSGTTTASTTETADSFTTYELRGKSMPSNIIAYAESPKKDSIFLLIEEGGRAIGYTATFSGASLKKAFELPLTQVTVEWPEANTIAITTKGSADYSGYLYIYDLRSGSLRKEAGPLPGLSTKVSRDGKYAVISVTGSGRSMVTSIYDLVLNKGTNAVIRTIADKCEWGNFYKEMVYCAAPAQQTAGTYPDDWYTGAVTFSDKMWQVNAKTNELTLISSIVDESDRTIDAYNLQLDEKDNYLFFMNKGDLSLWSLDLVSLSNI